MPAEQRRHVTDLRVLRAMANPVRYRIFSHLMAVGSQTASECADGRRGERRRTAAITCASSSGSGSWSASPDAAGDGRERPWRTVGTGFSFHAGRGRPGRPGRPPREHPLIHLGIDDTAALAHAATDAPRGPPRGLARGRGAQLLRAPRLARRAGGPRCRRRRPAPPVHRPHPRRRAGGRRARSTSRSRRSRLPGDA